ncbi:hypothetical protein [Asticcacaulis sp. 201]|uniref:hypothetical protein n=1 Tax=Asticcacaulis sp. 201 TaxID=3028787 RepID=UPI002916FF0E|nr:hypothetical protein [Asticcacaulis sp. 201]MDV6333151.1 hypothetical protein [Asticcacaulis sp. 201]
MRGLSLEQRHQHRQLRGSWGLALAAAWILFWWLRLDAEKHAALASPCPNNILYKAQDMLMGAGAACKGAIEGNFWGGMVFFAILSPLAWVVAHYIAGWHFSFLAAGETRKVQREERARQQAQQAAITDMGEKARREEQSSRTSNDRYELITRLGAVDDQLIVLADETAPERVKLIKMNIMQAVRDIHAKFRDEELRAMRAADSGIASRIERTLAEMRKLNLAGTRLYDDLASLFETDANTPPNNGAALS